MGLIVDSNNSCVMHSYSLTKNIMLELLSDLELLGTCGVVVCCYFFIASAKVLMQLEQPTFALTRAILNSIYN